MEPYIEQIRRPPMSTPSLAIGSALSLLSCRPCAASVRSTTGAEFVLGGEAVDRLLESTSTCPPSFSGNYAPTHW
jgi:hypothetical protein